MRWPHIACLGLAALLAASCSQSTTTDEAVLTPDDSSTVPAIEPAGEASSTTIVSDVVDAGPVATPVRHPANGRPIYFVMPDRFENGDTANDRGGVDGDQLITGFDPTRRGWHHGGDIAGLTDRLDYIADLGIGAIWITPPFSNNVVQGDGTIDGSSSSYHGYWQIDWTRIDPHLGSDEEMLAFIDAAHERDINVYFDVVVNHTGDVISFEEQSTVYWSTSARPYRDADGNEFDPADYAGGADFPELDSATSFAYTPTFVAPEDATAKAPDWLNDPTLYHNRGDSTFQGESDTYGDFFGLDDLFTEHPQVVEGMIELHAGLIDRYDIDGFRIDTMKHVNPEFWEAFAPAMHERAAELGKDDFILFGEIFTTDPILQSAHTNLGVDATLDFILNDALERFVTGSPADVLVQAFDDDDWFTDADNNASMQVTFFGNHDIGRSGYLIDRARPGADDAELLARARLGFDLLYFSRGTPVVYYGDEQGFTGDGGDQLARQDMFPSQTAEYNDDVFIGTDDTAAVSNFNPEHPLYQHIGDLAELRAEHPALTSGAQIVHEPTASVFAMSRIDRTERVEYIVVANSNASLSVPARFAPLTNDTTFVRIDSDDPFEVSTDEDGELLVEVPPLTTMVLRADSPLEVPTDEATIAISRPSPNTVIPTDRYRIEAALGDDRWAEVTFAVSVDGAEPVIIGVDDAPPYRIYWDNSQLPANTPITIVASAFDGSEQIPSVEVDATIGDR